ncbi:MAG: hypothetical protein KJO76_04340 [Gammaproteobacteria bacterium]|nr:hypothetical protein [Gammaproteobacteria bacterium]NND36565.1 hypothetical protein [Gammaproteobacteria bacterium]
MICRTLPLLICAAIIGAIAPSAHAAGAESSLTLAELAAWREVWPLEVTIERGARFQNGRSIEKGQLVSLDQVTPQGLRLADGTMFFMYPAEKTNVMQMVALLNKAMSPEQRALKMNDARRNDALWPTRVENRWTMQLDDNTQIAAGSEFVVLGFLPDGRLKVANIEQNFTVPIDPWETNFFWNARIRVGKDDGLSFSYRLLESMLEPSTDGTTVADYDYIVMYDGRDSCSRSTIFAPDLAKFQKASAASGAKWLLVFVNAASETAVNRDHYRNMNLTGRAAKDGWGSTLHGYFELGGYQTPWLHVFDRDGNEIATGGAPMDSYSQVLDILSAKVKR